ncbi:MAG: hypothetical protein WBG15_09655 [Xanthobacteraceae bacterium]
MPHDEKPTPASEKLFSVVKKEAFVNARKAALAAGTIGCALAGTAMPERDGLRVEPGHFA